MTQLVEIDMELLPTQSKMRDAEELDVAMIGGWGSGKTEDLAIEALIQSVTYEKNYGCVASATYPQLERSTIRKTFQLYEKLGLVEGLHYNYNKNNRHVTFYNGSQFYFQATNIPPGQLQGPELGWLCIDECETVSEESAIKLKSRVRKQNASRRRRYYGNPVPEGHWISKWFYEEPRENHKLFMVTTYENTHLPKDYIKSLEGLYPKGSVGYRRYLGGELGVPLEGTVYPEFNPKLHVVDKPTGDIIGDLASIDFGFNNPFCFLVGVVNGDDVIFVIGEHYASQMLLSDHAHEIRKIYKGGPIFADHDAQDREELANLGMRTIPAMKNVQIGIDTVRQRLVQGKLKFVRGSCPNLIREIGKYVWANDKEIPVKHEDHAMDAMRYLVTGLDYAGANDVSILADCFSSKV